MPTAPDIFLVIDLYLENFSETLTIPEKRQHGVKNLIVCIVLYFFFDFIVDFFLFREYHLNIIRYFYDTTATAIHQNKINLIITKFNTVINIVYFLRLH